MATKALNPAASIIEKFGGVEAVMNITQASRTRVYRWTQPRENGGTDGIIPTPHARKLLAHAEVDRRIKVTAKDFFASTSLANTLPSEGEAA